MTAALRANEFVQALATTAPPHLAVLYGECADLHRRKLWHQLTLKLEALQQQGGEHYASGDELIRLYEGFIKDFEQRLNALKLAQLCIGVSRQYSDRVAAVQYLEGIAAKVGGGAENKEARTLLQATVAGLHLKRGDSEACKKQLDEAKKTLDTMTGVDSTVYAAFYLVQSEYNKQHGKPADFYKSALQYLAYVQVDAVRDVEQLALDVGVAALVGDGIYNLQEMLSHAIMGKLVGTANDWVAKLLSAFNSGNLEQFQQLSTQHAAQMAAQPTLLAGAAALQQKIRVLALMELVFERSSERTIPFAAIATRTMTPADEVELLVMKTLSLKLARGSIDEINKTVTISWVQPRVLGTEQILKMEDRLGRWQQSVNATLLTLEAETSDLVA